MENFEFKSDIHTGDQPDQNPKPMLADVGGVEAPAFR
jgi:hypothetical protein